MSAAQTTSDAPARASQALTRQQLLLAGAGGAALLGAGGAIAPRLAQAAAGAKSGGTLRVGIGGGGPTDNFDAALINGPSATTRGQVFYETLVWLDGTFKLHNWLCDQLRAQHGRQRVDACGSSRASSSTTARPSRPDDVLFSIAPAARTRRPAPPPPRSSAPLDMKRSEEARRAHRQVRSSSARRRSSTRC